MRRLVRAGDRRLSRARVLCGVANRRHTLGADDDPRGGLDGRVGAPRGHRAEARGAADRIQFSSCGRRDSALLCCGPFLVNPRFSQAWPVGKAVTAAHSG